jgi:hypothetical protein
MLDVRVCHLSNIPLLAEVVVLEDFTAAAVVVENINTVLLLR